MERTLLHCFSLMSRKVIALLVMLIAVGLGPATAVVGFCAKMPCCFSEGHEDGGPAIGVDMADCCTTISCYEAPSHELTVSAKAKLFGGSVAVVLPIISAVPAAPAVRHVFHDVSPPPRTGERLASLSVFLI